MRSTVGARSRNSISQGLASYIESERRSNDREASPAVARLDGHRPRKRFSQSFLRDQRIADAIVRAARLTGTESVLEIGPGQGVLTQRLVRQAARVVAVEIDRDLAARLPSAISADNIQVLTMDALEFDPTVHDLSDYVLVANLPYHITSPILMRYLHEVTRPRSAILMMQREVAERISAESGQLSYLSIAVQSVATVETVRQVPPSAFVPRPKVDSTVLRITPRDNTDASPEFLKFVRHGFTQPRKRLANSLSQGLNVPKGVLDGFLAEHGISEQARAHELSIQQWRELSTAWTRRSE
jgi:16S rRNA (adenine1518-N6/adenine1519-N6)-dimethyltransferase